MKASAAKEKTTQLTRSRLAHRASGPSRSYLKTRVRGSRLYEAAFILAIAELTRRLHQAYEQAYDKQAADRLLPQNPTPFNQEQTDGARSDIASLLGVPRCANFMKGLLTQLGEITERDPYSTDPLVIFEIIARQGGLFLGSGSGGASAGGTLQQGTADIRINGLDSGPFSGWMNGRRWLHEITHGASKTGNQYSHTDMAQAAYDVTRVGRRVPGNPLDSGWKLRDGAASTYFEERLFDACRRY